MDPLLNALAHIFEGGQDAVIGLLVAVVIGCILIIRHMSKVINEKDQQLKEYDDKHDKLVDRYHEANLSVVEALNNVKIALIEMKSKL